MPSTPDSAHQLFFWLYPAYDADAPVVIWLTGGPGGSSTYANFLYNGPLRVATNRAPATNDESSTGSPYELYVTDQTWIETATVIFIDQPVGTGFSYSTRGSELVTSMDEAADEFVAFVRALWAAFPAFHGKDLYMTGESYAGHYIPVFSNALLEAGDFRLKASLIGDPFIAGVAQKTEVYRLAEALNILDASNMPQIAALRRNCEEELQKSDLAAAYDVCYSLMDYIEGVSGDVFAFD